MKNFKYSCVFIVFLLIVSNGYAKGNNIWNDVTQDSIQINSPVEFIDNYGKYTVISSKVKIKLSDFGNIDKNKNGIKYTLKNYGVQVLNGDKVFNVTLSDNPTANAFKALLPMTITMNELNNNEKVYQLSTTLPTNSIPSGTIQVGDFMLYGNNALVLFYESFTTSYTYTRLGKVDDIRGYKAALGSGNVIVKFELQ